MTPDTLLVHAQGRTVDTQDLDTRRDAFACHSVGHDHPTPRGDVQSIHSGDTKCIPNGRDESATRLVHRVKLETDSPQPASGKPAATRHARAVHSESWEANHARSVPSPATAPPAHSNPPDGPSDDFAAQRHPGSRHPATEDAAQARKQARDPNHHSCRQL